MKKVLSLFLVMTMIVSSMMVPVYAQSPSDDLSGHWSEKMMREWTEKGFVSGYSEDTYLPDKPITRAEFCAILDNVIKMPEASKVVEFSDINTSDWYAPVVKKAAAYGLVSGDNGNFYPDKAITREEVAVVLNKVLKQKKSDNNHTSTRFSDYAKVSDWAKAAVDVVTEKGYISGYPNGMLKPQNSITRAEAVTVLSNAFGTVIQESGEFESDMKTLGNVTIAAKDVTLKDLNITGNLYIAEAVADGDVTLENVTIGGDVIVKGGGENSIHFNNISVLGALIVKKTDNKVRIVATGSTKVNITYLESGALLVEDKTAAEGFNSVVLDAETLEGLDVELVGSFENVEVVTEAFNISLPENSTIKNLKVDEKANRFEIKGEGKVEKAQVDSETAKLDTQVDTIEVGENAKDVSVKGETLEPGTRKETPVTPPTSGGGGSGGGSSGGSSGGGSTPVTATVALSETSVSMTTGASLEVVATVNYTTSSFTVANLIWVSSDESVLEFDNANTKVSQSNGVLAVATDLVASALEGTVNVTVYAVKNPSASDVLAASNVYSSKSIEVHVWQLEDMQYSVYFDAQGGILSDDSSQFVSYGDTALEPIPPTKEGYVFLGWFLDDTLYDFETPVVSNLNLLAKWSDLNAPFVDARFETGYPSVVINAEGEMDIQLKLAEMPSEPVKAYVIASQYNASFDPSVEAVMHGHTGDQHPIQVAYNNMVKLDDTNLVTVGTGVRVNDQEAIAAIVLEGEAGISTRATTVRITGEASEELDTYAPEISKIFINEDRSKLYLCTYDTLNPISTAIPSDFTITLDGNPVVVGGVSVIKNAIEYYDAVEVEVNLASDIDIDLLQVTYTGTGIVDNAVDQNSLETFENYEVYDSQMMIARFNVSEDLDRFMIEFEPGIDTENYTLEVYYATDADAIDSSNQLDVHVSQSFNYDSVEFYGEMVSEIEKDSSKTLFVFVSGKNIAQDMFSVSSVGLEPVEIGLPVMQTAEYGVYSYNNQSFISVQYDGYINSSVFGCMYELKIVDSTSDEILEMGTLVGDGYGSEDMDWDTYEYLGTSTVEFRDHFYYGDYLGVEGTRAYLRYAPIHNGEYLTNISGKEMTEAGEWVEIIYEQ